MLEKAAGVDCVLLKKELATEVGRRQLFRMGYRVHEAVNTKGQRQLVGEKA
jgi:hypothetical protein